MTDWSGKDGYPPTPDGAGDGRMSGSRASEGKIVPLGSSGGSATPGLSVPAGLFFCALGGAVSSSTLSVVAPALVAYGYIASCVSGTVAARLGAIACTLVPALALSMASGVSLAATAVITCAAALVVSEVILRARMTPGVSCVLVAVLAACHLAVDEALAVASGTTLSETVLALVDFYQEQLGTVSSSVSAQLETVLALVWPAMYVVVALIEYLSARVGARVVSPRVGQDRLRLPSLADFDLPLWVVATFVISLAGLAVGLTLSGTVADAVLMASVNVVLAVRFALVAQGLAVLAWFGREHRASGTITALAGLAALYLEAQFFIMTVVGLVDVWSNFRHLGRGTGGTGVAGNAEQDQKSAQAD